QADTHCTTGLCVYWQAEPGTRFCTARCASDGDCPDGMTCEDRPEAGRVCYYEDDPPGVVGGACTTDEDCGSRVCDEAAGACVRDSNLGRNRICPSEFECKTLDGANYYCYAAAGGGGGDCRAAGDSGLGDALLGQLAAALVSGRRASCRPPR